MEEIEDVKFLDDEGRKDVDFGEFEVVVKDLNDGILESSNVVEGKEDIDNVEDNILEVDLFLGN